MSNLHRNVYFVSGCHGVGKGVFCSQLSSSMIIPHISASDLIQRHLRLNVSKVVNEPLSNQDVLISELKQYKPESDIILDGHLCLFNSNLEVEKIPVSVFQRMGIKSLVHLYTEPAVILERLRERDGGSVKLTLDQIARLGNVEIEYSKHICSELRINRINLDVTEEVSDSQIKDIESELRG